MTELPDNNVMGLSDWKRRFSQTGRRTKADCEPAAMGLCKRDAAASSGWHGKLAAVDTVE
jgi:hypothetical protein